MSANQTKYLIKVTSPDRAFGDGDFDCLRLRGKEELGRPFEIQLDLLGEDHDFSLDKFLGHDVTVSLELPDGGTRYFSGLVASAGYVGTLGRHAHFRLELRPWLWFLTHSANCRIFQDMTVPEIIKQVFRDQGFSDFKDSLSSPPKGSYAKREYCVQYRETDFDFVSRLMEYEGIYYYFEHEKSKHVLVLSDSYSAHEALNGCKKAIYLPTEVHERDKEHIYEWFSSQEVCSGAYSLTNFDFELPNAKLEVKSSNPAKHPLAKMEVYDYPGIHLKKADGEPYAQIRREELQCRFQRFRAEGNIRGLATGGLFTLQDHPRSAQNKEYLIVETEFELVSGEYEMGASEELSELYRCNLVAIGSKVPFRSRLNTPKPVVRGPQTAIITGPKDAEIHTDEHGRVKALFHWDRLGEKDEKSSCWIRVAQVWAGKGWGGVYNPRVGQEVIVDFLEGDPDRPIITGRVYNGVQKLPYKLPDHQTRTTFMTHSTTKGTDENFNELRFEDKKDEEEVYFHAEREFNRVVEENETLKVGMDKQEDGKGDRTVEIFNNRTVTLEKGNDKLQLKTGNRDILIDEGNHKHAITKGNRDVVIDAGNDKLQIKKGDREVLVDGGDQKVTIGKGDRSLTVSMGKRTTEVSGDDSLTISKGNHVTKVSLGESSLEAMKSISLKVGQNSIEIDNTGITIKGMQVTVEGTAKAEVKSPMTTISGDATAEVKSPMTTVSGDGILTLKGGLAKIN